MCGLFGAIGPAIDPVILQQLALLAGTRGPHACGWVYEGRPGQILTMKYHGPIKPRVPQLGMVKTRLLIGHCRLSTSGSHHDPTNNQPLFFEE
jgi:glutamine phosphoribosylpyrophosphate amidotransferase